MNITIKTRLLLGFGLSILLLMFVSIFSIMEINEASNRLEHVALNSASKVKMLADINENVTNIGRQQRNLLLAKTAQERERSFKLIESSRKQNSELLDKISGMLVTEQGRILYGDVVKTRNAYSRRFDPFFKLLDSNPEAAHDYLFGEFKTGEVQYKDNLDKFIVFINHLMESSTQEALDSAAMSRKLMIAAMIIGVLAAGGFALWILNSVTQSLDGINTSIGKVRDSNDFRDNVKILGRDEIGETAKAFNDLLASLRATLGELKRSIGSIDTDARELQTHAQESSQVAEINSGAASSMAAAVEQMSVSISHVADNAREAMALAGDAGQLAGEGGKIITDAVQEMQNISISVKEFSSVISELGVQSDQISSIVQIIREVADQTNLLALNAAIEAARAGETGRGFAVVADEVRKLAERTTSSASQIAEMIGRMQDNTRHAVDSMARTVTQVDSGTALAMQAGASIGKIRSGAASVASAVREISEAIGEQEAASQQIAQSVEKVAQASEETSATAHNTAEAAVNLEATADQMLRFVNKYSI